MMVSHVCTTSSLNYEFSLDACESCANDIIQLTESPCTKFMMDPGKNCKNCTIQGILFQLSRHKFLKAYDFYKKKLSIC